MISIPTWYTYQVETMVNQIKASLDIAKKAFSEDETTQALDEVIKGLSKTVETLNQLKLELTNWSYSLQGTLQPLAMDLDTAKGQLYGVSNSQLINIPHIQSQINTLTTVLSGKVSVADVEKIVADAIEAHEAKKNAEAEDEIVPAKSIKPVLELLDYYKDADDALKASGWAVTDQVTG